MANIVKVTGVEEIKKNLVRASINVHVGLARGLKKAGLLVQRESQKIVPVDLGNLKASAFTRKMGSGLGVCVLVGYTASYAVYVHENLEAKHKPGKTAKFLEKAAKENKDNIIKIIAEETGK